MFFFPLNVLVLRLYLRGRVPNRPPYPPPVGLGGGLGGRGYSHQLYRKCSFWSFRRLGGGWRRTGGFSYTEHSCQRSGRRGRSRGGGFRKHIGLLFGAPLPPSCPGGSVGRRRRRRRGWGQMWWGAGRVAPVGSPIPHSLSGRWSRRRGHCGAPAAAGTGALRALVAADRTGEPVRGPRAVEAGKAEIPVIMLAVLTAGFPLGRLADPAPRA